MEHAEMERFKATLHALRNEISQPGRRRDEIVVENAPDTLDRVQGAAERDLAIRQIESDFTRLQSVKLALERMEDGSYGTCLLCDEEISDKRLRAVPGRRIVSVARKQRIGRARIRRGELVARHTEAIS